jgi:hypothetical protein
MGIQIMGVEVVAMDMAIPLAMGNYLEMTNIVYESTS